MDREHIPTASLLIALLFCALSLAESPAGRTESVFSAPHPGQARALRLVMQGNDSYDAGDYEEAIALYRAALDQDPSLAAAWINLAAAHIERCEPESARVAAYMGRLLDSEESKAAKNLREALRMTCPGEEPSLGVKAGLDMVAKPQDPDSWLGMARLANEGKASLLEAFYLEQALLRGAPDENALRAAEVLLTRDMLRAASELMRRHSVAAERQQEIEARLERMAPATNEVAERLALSAGLSSREERDGLSRLAEVLLARDPDPDAAVKDLGTLLGIGRKRTIKGEWGTLSAGPAWVAVDAGAGEGQPLLTLRRFPGDLQLTLYSWAGVFEPADTTRRVESALHSYLAARSSPWEACALPDARSRCHRARFSIDLGAEGREDISVFLFPREEGHPSVAALGLIGDGGCGEECRNDAARALEEVLATLTPSAPGAPLPEPKSWILPTPLGWQASRAHTEKEDPWRSFALSGQKVVDLPPGLCVTSIGTHNRARSGVPGATMWFRGRFEDREGLDVVVGDSRFAGWIEEGSADQGAGSSDAIRSDPTLLQPATDSHAAFLALADLGGALSRAGAKGTGIVLLFEGGRFEGKWLVMHREFGGQVVDTYLPVRKGEGSLSLPWIALTQRELDSAPPPPLVDHSRRHEIRFKKIDTRNARAEPREGILCAGEAELPVPRGFRVSMSAATGNGFPVRLRSTMTEASFSLERWPASAGGTTKRRQKQVEAILSATPSEAWKRTKRTRGGKVWLAYFDSSETPQAEVCAVLLIPDEPGEKAAFYLSLARAASVPRKEWAYTCRLLAGIRYRRGQR